MKDPKRAYIIINGTEVKPVKTWKIEKLSFDPKDELQIEVSNSADPDNRFWYSLSELATRMKPMESVEEAVKRMQREDEAK